MTLEIKLSTWKRNFIVIKCKFILSLLFSLKIIFGKLERNREQKGDERSLEVFLIQKKMINKQQTSKNNSQYTMNLKV